MVWGDDSDEVRKLLGLPKPKPACTCGHTFQQHFGGGRCALWKPIPDPTSCWCDGYEPADDCRGLFPVVTLEQPKDE